jgi:hypothetical protein
MPDQSNVASLRERPNRGASNEWYTPPHIFEALGLEFDLDPCAPEGGVPWIPAKAHYSKVDHGLMMPWHGRVWLNPPYGTETWDWLERLAMHGDGIALIFARTETQRFHEIAPSADAICLIRGRLSFVAGERQGAGHNAAAPSVLLAWGQDCADALRRSDLGLVYVPHPEFTFEGERAA